MALLMTRGMVKSISIGKSAAKFLYNFIKERGSTTTIANPIYGDADYIKLCYIED